MVLLKDPFIFANTYTDGSRFAELAFHETASPASFPERRKHEIRDPRGHLSLPPFAIAPKPQVLCTKN